MDNTWATPLYFRAFEKGVDLSIQAGTKYIGGHSDVMFGCVAANAQNASRAEGNRRAPWACASGRTTCISALRGLRTLGVRLARHDQSGADDRALARAAAGGAARAASGAPKRSRPRRSGSAILPAPAACSASCSSRARRQAVYAFMNALTLFGMGYLVGRLRKPGDPVRLQRRTAPRPHGRRAARRCASISAWKTPTT